MMRHFLLFYFFMFAVPSFAVEAIYPFSDSAFQARFEQLIKMYRCVVCENQTLAESEATLAKDLRVIIHDKIVAGETDAQIDHYLTERFGDYIEYRPPFDHRTLFLWLGPFLLLLMAVCIVWKRSRIKRS
jgi:cytochrome c-type biogenesis protein CcmH